MWKLVIVVGILLVFNVIFTFPAVQQFTTNVLGTLEEVVPFLSEPIRALGNMFSYIFQLTYLNKFIGFILFLFFVKLALESFGAFSIKKHGDNSKNSSKKQ